MLLFYLCLAAYAARNALCGATSIICYCLFAASTLLFLGLLPGIPNLGPKPWSLACSLLLLLSFSSLRLAKLSRSLLHIDNRPDDGGGFLSYFSCLLPASRIGMFASVGT